jgi:diguanylate cyclase (GGDEF)-like protein
MLNLLVVDDEDLEVELIQEILEGEEYNLFKALSGEEALEILAKQTIHIILLDYFMPNMDGYAFCRRIKGLYRHEPIQIVLVSVLSDEDRLNRMLELGIDDFVKKPFDAMELQARVRAAAMRHKNSITLEQEEEYFRRIVERKEDLASLVKDHVLLKREYEDIKDRCTDLQLANDELERLAKYDAVSGLFNRLSLYSRIDVEIERAIRSQSPLTAVMLDVDKFKRINDELGHLCGDLVIKEIGFRIKSCLRKYDFGGRYGGDEFLTILPNSTSKQGYHISERIQYELRKPDIPGTQETVDIRISMGVAQYRATESRDTWIGRADRAMYAAKQSGGDCIALS